ncbi:uncharacterized protein PSFLO_02049 [Pseudozyma flocculosa]|uniref:Uncharacterized protein n=1 Tax=Pseudozyma flocculosa TaxID=84751 RepID=A0A5C3EWI2_9BASI|nr:uncharacterized protein PSFLO_02049 [Pseudozyma flocculosa]
MEKGAVRRQDGPLGWRSAPGRDECRGPGRAACVEACWAMLDVRSERQGEQSGGEGVATHGHGQGCMQAKGKVDDRWSMVASGAGKETGSRRGWPEDSRSGKWPEASKGRLNGAFAEGR